MARGLAEMIEDMTTYLPRAVQGSYPKFKEEMMATPGRALQGLADYEKENPLGFFSSMVIGAPGGSLGSGGIARGVKKLLPADLKRKALDAALDRVGPVRDSRYIPSPAESSRGIRLKSGEVVEVPKDFPGDHADIVNTMGINLDDVDSTGWVMNGQYKSMKELIAEVKGEGGGISEQIRKLQI